jgi:hypothetical protein
VKWYAASLLSLVSNVSVVDAGRAGEKLIYSYIKYNNNLHICHFTLGTGVQPHPAPQNVLHSLYCRSPHEARSIKLSLRRSPRSPRSPRFAPLCPARPYLQYSMPATALSAHCCTKLHPLTASAGCKLRNRAKTRMVPGQLAAVCSAHNAGRTCCFDAGILTALTETHQIFGCCLLLLIMLVCLAFGMLLVCRDVG